MRHAAVQDWKRKEANILRFRQRTFFREPEFLLLGEVQERHHHVETGAPPVLNFVREPVASAWAGQNRELSLPGPGNRIDRRRHSSFHYDWISVGSPCWRRADFRIGLLEP